MSIPTFNFSNQTFHKFKHQTLKNTKSRTYIFKRLSFENIHVKIPNINFQLPNHKTRSSILQLFESNLLLGRTSLAYCRIHRNSIPNRWTNWRGAFWDQIVSQMAARAMPGRAASFREMTFWRSLGGEGGPEDTSLKILHIMKIESGIKINQQR